jgi:hypothetical protein
MEQEFRRHGRVASTTPRPIPPGTHGSSPGIRTADVERLRNIAERLTHTSMARTSACTWSRTRNGTPMAAPNGAIYAFSGLLRDLDDDEVAIVLGHELAHATHGALAPLLQEVDAREPPGMGRERGRGFHRS